jgi:nitronate monooxygenase
MGVIGGRPNPVVAAPMAGGASTPRLAAAVSNAGGLGFVAAGYLTVAQLDDRIAEVRTLTSEPFAVNLFVPGAPGDVADVARYAERLAPVAERYGVTLGEPRHDDDDWAAKLDVVRARAVPAVSFTFGCPDAEIVASLHEVGTEVCVTVTSAGEARIAAAAGADVLCVQGMEAGAHRATFLNDPASPTGGELIGLLPLLRQVAGAVDLPLMATGGLMTGADIAAVLAAGAVAAQLGTAFLCCPESGAPAAHQRALLERSYPTTAVTRAFSGRPARGLANQFLLDHGPHAPAAYPEVHHLTRPLRAAGDPEAMSLWAGQGFAAIRPMPAADLVATLTAELAAALNAATARWAP